MMDYDIIGAIKIKDGLFLGDEYAAQDLEFIVTNKVTKVINCSARQTPNHWEAVDVAYLSYGWLETDSQVIFDSKDEVLNTTFNLIEDTLEQAESVLVHSIRGQNRSVCVIAAYLMKKYRWTLYKTMEFIHSRRQDLEIKASFFNQLLSLENRLTRQGFSAKSYNWKELSGERTIENDEWVLTNTFLNAKIGLEEEDEDEKEENNNNEGDKSNKNEDQVNKQVIEGDENKKKEGEVDKSEKVAVIPEGDKKVNEIEDFNLLSFEGESEDEKQQTKEKDKQKQTENESNNKNDTNPEEIKVQQKSKSNISEEAVDTKKQNGKGKEKQSESKVPSMQNTKKIRKIVWNDEETNSKGLCQVEIPTYDTYPLRKISSQPKLSFYRSILKGSNRIFPVTSGKNAESQQKENKEGDTTASGNSIIQSALNSSNSSSGLRKIGSIKMSTLKAKKPEDALQEKRIIMQKITNSTKDLSTAALGNSTVGEKNAIESSIPKSSSLQNVAEDVKVQNSLNSLATKQLKEVMAKYDQPIASSLNGRHGSGIAIGENNLGLEFEGMILPSSKGGPQSEGTSLVSSGNKEKRKKVSRKELQQAAMDSRGNGNYSMPLGQLQSGADRGKTNQTNTTSNGVFELLDDEFNFGGISRGQLSNTFSGFGNNSANTAASAYGMSVSAKNFFNNNNNNNNNSSNQNFYPMTSSASNSQLNNPPKFSIKNSFKSTQKIYSSSFSKPPQTNNFLFSQNKNTPEIGFQIQRLGSRAYGDDKKLPQNTAKPFSRPSTAPLKQTPYQRMIIGNSIKPSQMPSHQPYERQLSLQTQQLPSAFSSQQQQQQQQQPQTQQTQVVLSLGSSSQQQQQSQAHLIPAINVPSSNRQSNLQQPREDSARKSLRSNSAGNSQNNNTNYPTMRPPQFGFFQSHKARWKF